MAEEKDKESLRIPQVEELGATVAYSFFEWRNTSRLIERFWDRRARKEFDFYDWPELYHENTKYRRYKEFQLRQSGDVFMGIPPIVEASLRAFKEYPNKPKVQLPLEEMEISNPLDRTIMSRRSSRAFTGESIGIRDLSKLLYYTNGITACLDYEEWGTGQPLRQFLRASPSGGALYPIELYAGVINVENVTPGIYHYNVREHSLARLKRGDESFPEAFASAFPIHGEIVQIDKSAVVLILSAVFERSKAKYGPRSYRYILQESGHVAQNTCLVATACGLGSVALDGFYDDDINEWLEIDGVDEAVVYTVMVGKAHPNPDLVSITPDDFHDRVKSLYEEEYKES